MLHQRYFSNGLFTFFVVNGGFTEWGEYSKCSADCGGGTQYRTRTCTNPSPQHGGKACEGDCMEERDCNTEPCPSKLFCTTKKH